MAPTASTQVGDVTVEVVVGDLTTMDVDVIVNAANKELQHGGGVAGAIARAGGPAIQSESDAWIDEHGPLDEGEAATTTAGDLPAGYVVHTAGPVYEDGSERNEPRLRAAVRAALDAADELGAGSIALPAISAGIYGYPPADATAVIADEVVSWSRNHEGEAVIKLVAIDDETAELFASGLDAATGADR